LNNKNRSGKTASIFIYKENFINYFLLFLVAFFLVAFFLVAFFLAFFFAIFFTPPFVLAKDFFVTNFLPVI